MSITKGLQAHYFSDGWLTSLKDARNRMFEEWKECLETETTVPLPETRKGNIDDFIGFGFKRDGAWTDWGASWKIFKNDIN